MVHGSAIVSFEILSTTHVRDPLRDARLPLLRPTLLPTPSTPPSSDPPQDASAPAAPLSILSATDASLSSAPPSSLRHPHRHHWICPNNGQKASCIWIHTFITPPPGWSRKPPPPPEISPAPCPQSCDAPTASPAVTATSTSSP
jgi:hypothetical protein